MVNKQVLRYKNIRDKQIKGADTIADPIRETMGPKGKNVIFEDSLGNFVSTNDGKTIATQISVKDPIENSIISIIKSSSLKTNSEVGDGTSTSVLLSQILLKEGFKLIDNGLNQMDVKRRFEKISEKIIEELNKLSIKVKNDKELLAIAKISANSDEKIAQDIVEVVKVVGNEGMVFMEPNNKADTEIKKELGFTIDSGLFSGELRNNPQMFAAMHQNIPVLITDKRLYYSEEAETILETVMKAGYKGVAIVARDFIGQFPNHMIANHGQHFQVMLVKEPRATDKDSDSLYDLATYLGGKVVSEKNGSLVDNITIEDFVLCQKIFADGVKTIITSNKKRNKELNDRVEALKKELDKNKNDEMIKKRIASLTSGTVTIKVGGSTQIETIEKMYRYEDALHAVRAAVTDGYLPGGGIALMSIFDKLKLDDEFAPVFRKYCEGNVRQISENCGEHQDSIVKNIREANSKKDKWTIGYNANTGNVEDLLKAGVVDPYKVTEMAVRNSISVVSQIISSNFLILNDVEDEKKDK